MSGAARKAATRNSPHWLDALELPADPLPVRVYPPERTKIYARRRELQRRVYPVTVPTHAPKPMPRHRSAVSDALRNAGLLIAVMIALAACAHYL